MWAEISQNIKETIHSSLGQLKAKNVLIRNKEFFISGTLTLGTFEEDTFYMPQAISLEAWSPPPLDFIKLNFDSTRKAI